MLVSQLEVGNGLLHEIIGQAFVGFPERCWLLGEFGKEFVDVFDPRSEQITVLSRVLVVAEVGHAISCFTETAQRIGVRRSPPRSRSARATASAPPIVLRSIR